MKIVLIGAGNVATHIGKALFNEGHRIEQVFSRTMKSALELASKFNTSFTTDIKTITDNGDIYIIAISDIAIPSIIQSFPHKDKLIIHTAGSVEMSVFEGYAKQYGVMYPLQTFSKFKDLDFSNIPIFVEANNDSVTQTLIDFASILSHKVTVINSKQRVMLHLCAVFACNFSNHMCAIAEDILQKNNLRFDILKPLLQETFEKLSKHSPFESQTGPAVRNDINIVYKHVELLCRFPKFVTTYKIISDSIIDMHNNK